MAYEGRPRFLAACGEVRTCLVVASVHCVDKLDELQNQTALDDARCYRLIAFPSELGLFGGDWQWPTLGIELFCIFLHYA